MGKFANILTILGMIVLFMVNIEDSVMAAEDGVSYGKDTEIVFLLDASASMKDQDKGREAVDGICQAAYGLTSNCRTGAVVYNTDVQAVIPLETEHDEMEELLSSVVCTGYTNAGAGLNQALDLFSSEVENVDQCIIMVTDGEIDMPDKQGKELSRSLYEDAVGRAREKGVKIFIVALGTEFGGSEPHIFDGAEMTDGLIYWEGQSGSLSGIMKRIITERVDFPKQTFKGTENGEFTIEVPAGASKVKLVITAENEIEDVQTDYGGKGLNIKKGQRFVVLDIKDPIPGTFGAVVQGNDVSETKAYLVVEYMVKPKVSAEYRLEELPRTEKEIRKNVPPQYEHFVDVCIELEDLSGRNENIWAYEGFEGKEISYSMNGVDYAGRLEQGKITQTLPAEGIDHLEVSVKVEEKDAVYYIKQPVKVDIEKIPEPEFEPLTDYRPLIGIMCVLAVAFAGLLLVWLKKKNATIIYMAPSARSHETAQKVETKSCAYSGKLNLYMVRTVDGRDVPPQTYRLFGRRSGRITLQQILGDCKIRVKKGEAEDIVLYPGSDHTVIIMDQSEKCTVMRGMEILKKGMGYPVFYNEKVTVSFEDEETELELHYKSLKPSEMENGW